MNAYFAHTMVGFKGQSNPVKKVMFAVVIEGVIFIVMSLLAIRLMIFKIFSAWTMKAPMAGVGMLLAFIGLHSGNGIDPIRDHPADSFMTKSFGENELEENNANFQKWLRELETYGTELTKTFEGEKSKVHNQLSKLELSKIDDNEQTPNDDNKNELPKEFCSFRIAAYSLCFNAAHYNFFKNSFSTKFVHYKLRKEKQKNNELEKNFGKNLENKIFKKKLVPLLPDRHFALAASFQLLGTKHGRSSEKLRWRSFSPRRRETKSFVTSFEENNLTTKLLVRQLQGTLP